MKAFSTDFDDFLPEPPVTAMNLLLPSSGANKGPVLSEEARGLRSSRDVLAPEFSNIAFECYRRTAEAFIKSIQLLERGAVTAMNSRKLIILALSLEQWRTFVFSESAESGQPPPLMSQPPEPTDIDLSPSHGDLLSSGQTRREVDTFIV